ncbi:MAG: hypothetical protein NTX91_02615 [candidate division SR1 bacterium]|nr:hypothetical protein [candidate division SR1 bacterium]
MNETFTFTLPYDDKRKEFCMGFKGISRSLLQKLKDKKLLESVVPELFPETLDFEIIIDHDAMEAPNIYSVDFYTTMMATKEMRQPVISFKNRSIDVGEDIGDTVSFYLDIPKDSEFITKDSPEEIIVTF